MSRGSTFWTVKSVMRRAAAAGAISVGFLG